MTPSLSIGFVLYAGFLLFVAVIAAISIAGLIAEAWGFLMMQPPENFWRNPRTVELEQEWCREVTAHSAQWHNVTTHADEHEQGFVA